MPPAPAAGQGVGCVGGQSSPLVCEPSIPSPPDQAPDAEHEVALAADHVRVELLPLITELGLAPRLMVTVGAPAISRTPCSTAPRCRRHRVQVKVYVAAAVSAPVDCEPLQRPWRPTRHRRRYRPWHWQRSSSASRCCRW